MRIRKLLLVWLVMEVFAGGVHAQDPGARPVPGSPPVFEPRPQIPEALSFFASFFFPKIFQDDYRLKDYLLSDEFADFRRRYGDVYAIDALFDRAMRFAWNNVAEALFISFVSTMDHDKFGVRIPLIGPLLWVPLTSEFRKDFQSRLRALPSHLYPDTPPEGDRDKLQHFFGSALVTYMTESREAGERVGYFIEWGEDKFIVGGVMDERDMRANRQGQQFGLRLLDDPLTRPSDFFRFALAEDPDAARFYLEER